MLQDLAVASRARTGNTTTGTTAAAAGTRSSSIDGANSTVPKEDIDVQSGRNTASSSSDAAAAAVTVAPSRATRLMAWWRGGSTVETAAATASDTTAAVNTGSAQSSGAIGSNAAAGSRISWRASTAGAAAAGAAGSASAASGTVQLLQQQAYHVASLSISRVTLTLLTVSQQPRTPAASPPLRTQQSSDSSSTTAAATATAPAAAAAAQTVAHNTPPRHYKTLTAPALSPSVLLNSSIDENFAITATTADSADDALSISVPVYGIGAVTVSTPATARKKVMPHHQEPLLILEVCNMYMNGTRFAVCCSIANPLHSHLFCLRAQLMWIA
jgi:hypothetical protein